MASLTHNAWSHTVSYWGGIRQELKASLPVSCAEGEEAQTFLLLAIFPTLTAGQGWVFSPQLIIKTIPHRHAHGPA